MENNKRRRIYQNRRSLPTRLLSFVLCMVLTLTYSGVNTFAMSGDTKGDSEKEIIAFSSLPDGVREQEIRQGEDLSAVTFPDTLQILVEETALVDKNSMSKDKVFPKATQSELPLVETKEEEAENSVKADVEETAEPAKDNTSAEESVEAEKSDTSAVEPAKNSDENEVIKETALKDVTLQNVRWEIDEENSSKTSFSSENIGDSFVFNPVIPEQYNIAEDVELPKIHVSIRDKASAKTAFEASAVVDGVKISVKADDGVFKDAQALKVRKVSNSEAEKVKEAIEEKRETGKNVATSYTFDIAVLDAFGNEVQPDTKKGEVSVSFQMEEAKNQNLSADIYHVDETSQAEKLETEVKGDEVSAKTDGFSFYTVEFTYGSMQYVLAGDSQIDLSEILAKVGLSGEVTAVAVSNSSLFSAEKTADNKWMITAHKAFDTREWMKVTIKDVIYEIAVTDSQHPLTVTGGIENVDYKWENYSYNENLGDHSAYKLEIIKKYILHILSSEALLIEGDATKFNEGDGGAIVIPESVKANITLKNTKIFPMVNIPPMVVMKNAECKLTLEGENTLTPRLFHVTAGAGAFDKVPAIWVPEGAKLTVSEASTGTLTASSAYQHAVIGGWKYGRAGTMIINGGTLKLNNDGDINSITNISGPCIGGNRKFELIEINGGKIEATCVQSAPIGMSYEPIVDVDAKGKVIVNGGTIVTKHQTRDGVNPYYADGIGDTQHHTAVDVIIRGGNVDTDFDRTRPIKGHDNPVYRAKITLLGAGEGQTVTSYTLFDGETKYLQDTKTLPNGELYLWLSPAQNQIITSVHCGGQDYTGVVKAVDNDTDAQAVFRTSTTGTGTLTASLKAEHVQGVKLNQTTGLSAGDTVYLSFSGVESGYLFKGMCLYTGTTLPPAPREVSSDFTKITDKLYSFKMPAENVTVYLNAPKIRTVRAGEQTHIASVSFTPTDNLTVGDTVKLSYITEAGWKATGMALRKATDSVTTPQDISSDFTKLSEGSYQFTMPDYDVCVDFKCEEKAASGTEAGDFIISDANCNYSFDTTSRTLMLSGGGRATISMKPGVSSTSDHIRVEPGSSINLTIRDLTVSTSIEGLSGLTFSNNIRDCQLILEGTNKFTSDDENTPAVRKKTFGKLTISGKGKLIAIATGANSNGIGSGDCVDLYIEGGTIYAKASHDNMAIGHAKNGSDSVVYYTGGTVEGICEDTLIYGGLTGMNAEVTITGGSIHSMNWGALSASVHPTNGSAKVYCSTITLGEGATLAKQAYVTALTGAGAYGINHMHTDDEGKLYLWLPENTTVTKVETDKGIYQGSVTTNTANYFGTANAVFTLAEKQEGSGSVAIEGWTYGESAKAPVPTSTTNGTANVSYTYFTDEACTIKTTSDNSGADSEGGVPKNAGSYWVQATFAETPRYKAVTAKAGFEISKATVPFTPPTAKTNLSYTGNMQELINAGSVDSVIGRMEYSLSETGIYSETIPKEENAGSYSVYYKVAGTNANYDYSNAKGKVDVSIAKAEVSFTVPTAKTGLVYKGEEQELINAGSVDSAIGRMEYSLSETGPYHPDIPKASAAGSHSVYYKVVGTNANYDYSKAKGKVDVSITKVQGTPTVEIVGWTYGASPNVPIVIGNKGNGAVTYEYFIDETCMTKTTAANSGAESTGGVPKNAGKYWVKATIAETANYTVATAKATFEISKADVPFTAPTPKDNLSDTEKMQELINAGSVDSNIGEMQYSLKETEGYSKTIPTAKDVGSYRVYYKVVGTNANYDYSNAKGSVEVSIHKTYEVTVIDGTGGGKYAEGETVSIKANDKSGYTFSGWTSDDGVIFVNSAAKETSFVMPAKEVKVTANYSSNSSGSSGDSGGSNDFKDDSGITIKPEKAPDLPTTAEIATKAKTGDDKTAKAELSEKTAEKAIRKAKEEAKKKGKEANGIALEINMTMPKGTDKVQMHLSESTLEKMVSGEVKSLTVNGSLVKVVFDKNAIFEIKKQSKGEVSLNVIPVKKLSGEAENHIGGRPVYDISLRGGQGQKITDFGNGKATVFLSYKAEKNEAIGGLYVVYVDEKEKASRIDRSAYDVNSGSVIFTTNHLSIYGVGYTAPSEKYDDTKNHWAKDYIDYVAGRGLITGSTENTFSPNEKMTRGMLVTALGRLAGVNSKDYDTNSFSDVQKDSTYRPYIEWAYSKGIVYGIGDGTFAPDKSITREEMAIILERYAKATGYNIPASREASTYADKENIGSEYRTAVTAMQQSGIMMGIDGNKFNPKGTATRAEVSAMLSRYIKLTITPETAQGFAIDDAGKYHCYKDGKAMTGKQTINGMVYFFDESGVLQTGWVKDGNRWRYYDGAKAHKGWLHLKTDGEEKIYYLNKEGLLESGKWVKIDGKWYYFYPDGTLAVNTKIDGYEIDSKGVRKEK